MAAALTALGLFAGAWHGPVLAASADDFADKFLQLGTGPVGGTFRPIGEALCDAVNDDRRATLVRCVPVGTAGSAYNLHAVAQGGMQLGLAQEDLVSALYKNRQVADGAALRVIAVLHSSPIAVMAHRAAGVTALRQIAGKAMNLGNRGSGQFTITASILRALGLRNDDLGSVSFLPTGEFERAFCDRKVDVVVETVAHPSPLFDKLRACGGEFIDIPPDVIARMLAENALLSAMVIPALTYPGQTQAVQTLGMRNLLFTHAGVGEEAVFRLVSTLRKRHAQLLGAQPLLGSMVAMDAVNPASLPAPLHPGALRALQAAVPVVGP
jgi:TRAP transporter TAXI family solute receptor